MKSVNTIVKELRACGELDEAALCRLKAEVRSSVIKNFLIYTLLALVAVVCLPVFRWWFIAGFFLGVYGIAFSLARCAVTDRVNIATYGEVVFMPAQWRPYYGASGVFDKDVFGFLGRYEVFFITDSTTGAVRSSRVQKKHLYDGKDNLLEFNSPLKIPVGVFKQKTYPILGTTSSTYNLKLKKEKTHA